MNPNNTYGLGTVVLEDWAPHTSAMVETVSLMFLQLMIKWNKIISFCTFKKIHPAVVYR